MALQQQHTLVKKTTDRGACCMMSIVEWGHALLEYEENLAKFDDEDHMNFVGEFTFRVNETCLNNDHSIFMVAPTDRDAHNPILVHLKPSDMTWPEKRQYVPREMKQRRHDKRKEMQRQNKRKGYGFHGGGPGRKNWHLHRPQDGPTWGQHRPT